MNVFHINEQDGLDAPQGFNIQLTIKLDFHMNDGGFIFTVSLSMPLAD